VEAHLRIVALRLGAARGDDPAVTLHDHRLAALEPVIADAEDRAALAVARAEVALGAGHPEAVRGLIAPLLDRVRTPGPSIAWLGALAVQAEVGTRPRRAPVGTTPRRRPSRGATIATR
jgi:hypothetical protein